MVYIYDKYIDWARGLPPKNKRATHKRINVNITYEWRNAETEACLARAPADGKRGRPPQRGHERLRHKSGAKGGNYLPVSNGQVAEQKSTDECCGRCGGLGSAVMEVNVLLRRRLARASLLGNTLPPTTAQPLRHSHTQGIARGSGSREQAARPTRQALYWKMQRKRAPPWPHGVAHETLA